MSGIAALLFDAIVRHVFHHPDDLKKAKQLLEAGADLTARDEHIRSTPLAWAGKFGQLEMVRFLLERGAPKTLPGDPPWATPRQWALKRGHKKIAELL
jgi:ankyrin repeat protein